MTGRFRPFDEAALARISAAVAAAEERSHGEIVPVVVPRCEAYPEAQDRGGVGGAVLATGVVLLLEFFGIHLPALLGSELHDLVAVQALAFVAGYQLARVHAVARALIGRGTLAEAARWRAEIAFREHGLARTANGTGVLLFASLFEHQVVVLGDAPVVERVGQGGFQAIVDRMIGLIREDRAADGFVEAIEALGVELERHFPPTPGAERNELPDHLRT